ncbi:MAG: hypothetical protein WC975_12490 [Phycisphaerae bacterium]
MPLDEVLLLCFFVICLFQSIAIVGIVNEDYDKVFRHLIVLALGVLSYVSLKKFFQLYGVDYALKLMGKVYIFVFAVGILEILSIAHVLPWSVKALIGRLLSGRVVDRVQLITSEASWAAKVLLLGIPIYTFLLMRYKKAGYLAGLIVAVGLLCFTLSLEGLVTAGIAILLFALFKYRTIMANPRLGAALVLVVIGFGSFFYLSYRLLPKGGQYYLTRIHALESLNVTTIKKIPETDGSVFIRVYYPLVGGWMFLEKPYGVGLGGYSVYFKQFLDRTGIDYTRFGEVMGDIRTRTGDPKSLYAKILSENGLYSGWVLILFCAIHLYYLKQIRSDGIIPYRNLIFGLLAVNLAVLFQFGSYAYLPMWFTLALNTGIYQSQSAPARI